MSHFIKPNREQLRYQTLDIEKLVPEDHPVRFFWKVCESLDLKSLYDDYKITENSEGRPANDPRVLLCLWIYAYSDGIRDPELDSGL
jgi:transposase